MWRGLLWFSIFMLAVWLVAPPKQMTHVQQSPEAQHNQSEAASNKPTPNANAGQSTAKGCPGSYFPKADCAAISANADVEQAVSARDQTGLLRYEVALTFATFVVAALAMVFAKVAADANRATVSNFIEVERADLVITLENFVEKKVVPASWPRHPEAPPLPRLAAETFQYFEVLANNIGRTTALITSVRSEWFDTASLKNPPLAWTPRSHYIVKAGEAKPIRINRGFFITDRESVGGHSGVPLLRDQRFLWIEVNYRSPLRRDERVLVTCFEVNGINATIPYEQWLREEYDKGEAKPPRALPFGLYYPSKRTA